MKAARWGKGLTCPVKYGIINSVTYGEMSERFKELVLKTSDPVTGRGFESHSLRQNISSKYTVKTAPWRSTQVGDEAPLLRA